MLCLSGFELYSRWVPLVKEKIIVVSVFIMIHSRDKTKGNNRK